MDINFIMEREHMEEGFRLTRGGKDYDSIKILKIQHINIVSVEQFLLGCVSVPSSLVNVR